MNTIFSKALNGVRGYPPVSGRLRKRRHAPRRKRTARVKGLHRPNATHWVLQCAAARESAIVDDVDATLLAAADPVLDE